MVGVVKGDMRSLDYSSCGNIISTEGPRSFPLALFAGPKKGPGEPKSKLLKGDFRGERSRGY